MFDAKTGRVFALPAGCDFPAALVAGLQARLAGQSAQSMARVTLYVNTARMQTRIKQIFAANGAAFLPKLRLITQLDQDPRLALPVAESPLRQHLQLATLIEGLLRAQPDLAPRSAVYDLALSLSALLDEMQSEDVSPQAVGRLDVSGHSAHWARAQAFLNIVAPLFAQGQGAGARQRLAAKMLADLWAANPPQDPILIAGTTGSRKVTAEFMQTVLSLPQGAVILPGFDFDLPQTVWQHMDDALTSEDHPQYRFSSLMNRLAIGFKDVTLWHNTPAPAPDRNRLVSLALRPAPVTDQWLRDGPSLPDLRPATADLTLIEAPSARAEALAIALVLRKAAEDGIKAALITPDRNLSRQVTAALDRFGILPDDSAGRPLALSAAGRFLRHTAALRVEPLSKDRLLTLLKHPLSFSGAERGAHLMFTRELELHLRRYGPAFPDHASLTSWAKARSFSGVVEWAAALRGVFDAKSDWEPRDLNEHIAAHIDVSQQLAQGGEGPGSGALWQGEAGIAAHKLLVELGDAASAASPMTAQDYRHLFETLLQSQTLREPQISHPNILIWGTIEARVQGCDLVILGGLNEGIWPKAPAPDPWLNRKMRASAGLLLPDRQIGLAAHDFQQAIGAPKVVLTRALRNADSETIPSRWLNRLKNLTKGLPNQFGPEALDEMTTRGKFWLDLARCVDQPSPEMMRLPALQPSPRPAPVPPISARPRELPVTAMEHLILNPYHVYARYILGLRRLAPMRASADSRDQGTAVHLILEQFVKSRPENESSGSARARLHALATQVFAQHIAFPAARALWLAKLMHVADFFFAQDKKWGGVPQVIENKGRYQVPDLDFTVTATPDRIDLLPDGRLHLIDYKTGAVPSKDAQAKHKKQLLFTAVMAQNGAFATLGAPDVAKISYLSLSRGTKALETDLTPELIAAEAQTLHTLITAYMSPDIGYAARRADFSAKNSEYDHVMRFGEWDTSDRAVSIIVGKRL